ncbi:aspartic protease [Aphelenchoides avenae]|nr:aspartic protease [Aphelenchus avenae]
MAYVYAVIVGVSALVLSANAAPDLPKTRLHRSAYVGGPNGWDQFYVIHLDLGTPRQTFFNLTMDFTNAGLFLFGSEPKRNPCSKTLPSRLYFDKKQSSTIKGPLSPYNYNFWQSYVCNIHDSVFDGGIYVDDWTFEGHPLKSIPFVLVNDGATGLNPHWPSDGILGLAAVDPVHPLPSQTYSGVRKVLSQLPEPVITIYMDQ